MVIVEEELKKAYQKMLNTELTVLSMEGWSIYLRHLPDSFKLSISASVYEGGNFIPKSVRGNLHHKVPFYSPIKTRVNVDEENFRILLNYVGISESLTLSTFKVLIEEFLQQADWWKLFLDEHDKHDLVYVRVS